MFIDATNMIIGKYNENFDCFISKWPDDLPPSCHPQAALMFAKLATHNSGIISNNTGKEFYDFQHSINFQALATCLAKRIDPSVKHSFVDPLQPDKSVQAIFRLQVFEELNYHQAYCIINGIRKCFIGIDKDEYKMKLTKCRRRSALYLLNSSAQIEVLARHETLKESLKHAFTSARLNDDLYFGFAGAVENIKYLQESNNDSWKKFELATGVTAEHLSYFSGFIFFLDFAIKEYNYRLWHDESSILKAWAVFSEAYPCANLPESVILHLLNNFSLTPQKSVEYLLPVPFLKIDGKYLTYVDYSEIMSPGIGLLTILIRKYEKAWSQTVGSTLACAADVVAKSLPINRHLSVSVRRKIKGKGDIDLVVYDSRSRTLVLCEIKTVYDKHRTVRHMRRFEEAKVNLSHAIDQLRKSIAAIEGGSITVKDIFGKNLQAPSKIIGVLLTWLDPIDLTVGTLDEDILCLNFATFSYLLKRSRGDVASALITANELRNIWCVSEERSIDIQTSGPATLEVQIPMLDAMEDLSNLQLSQLTLSELHLLPLLPNGWRLLPDFTKIISYLDETRDFVLEFNKI